METKYIYCVNKSIRNMSDNASQLMEKVDKALHLHHED